MTEPTTTPGPAPRYLSTDPHAGLLTPAQFAQAIKAQYPAYADMPDDVLVAKVLKKYPEYRARVQTYNFSGIPKAPRPAGLPPIGAEVPQPTGGTGGIDRTPACWSRRTG